MKIVTKHMANVPYIIRRNLMSKKSSKRNHKRIKEQQRQKKFSKICYTSLICLLSITSILYLFLIADKLTQTIYLKETLTEITALQNDVKSLDGKYSKIIKTIELKDKLKKVMIN